MVDAGPNILYDRLGASLRRAPFVWLVATILLMLLLNDPSARMAVPNGRANPAITMAGVVFVAYAIVMSTVIVPRLSERLRSLGENRLAVFRWTLAAVPFLLSYAAVAAGSQQWVYALGQVASVTLLVATARRIRRAGPAAERP
jgi:hypothetical protein